LINKIVARAVSLITLALSLSLGYAYITLGMTDRVERGCWVLYICVIACIWFGARNDLHD